MPWARTVASEGGRIGAATLLSSRTVARLSGSVVGLDIAAEAVSASAGSQIMIALAAIVLGILALAGLASAVLIEVALLILGFAVLMVGALYGSSLASS